MRRTVLVIAPLVTILLTASACPSSDGGNHNPPPTDEIHKP